MASLRMIDGNLDALRRYEREAGRKARKQNNGANL